MIWFTADTHFSHTNVIKYCNRPFEDAHHMNKVMTDNWNSVVRPNDIVWHLGDVGFCGPDKLVQILKRLNGKKHLILGNHDHRSKKSQAFLDQFESVQDGFVNTTLQDSGETYRMTLCHYAMRTWYRSCHGTWMLYGHSHGRLPESACYRSMDVGVDANNFTPISIREVAKIMEKRGPETEDCIGKNYGKEK